MGVGRRGKNPKKPWHRFGTPDVAIVMPHLFCEVFADTRRSLLEKQKKNRSHVSLLTIASGASSSLNQSLVIFLSLSEWRWSQKSWRK